LQSWDGMIHVFQMFSELAEARQAIASLSQFLRKHLRVQTGSKPP
jgi:epsilon-lactone hydrolase